MEMLPMPQSAQGAISRYPCLRLKPCRRTSAWAFSKCRRSPASSPRLPHARLPARRVPGLHGVPGCPDGQGERVTKAEREMIVVATSAANRSQYCIIAHGAILRIRAKNPLIADQIATNYRKADITPRQKAMLDFAMKVSADAQRISEDDFTTLAPHGFSDDDIWDIAAISAFFALSNRL